MLTLFGHNLSGSTANRPTNADYGQPYFDTTLGVQIFWNGSAWTTANGQVAVAPGNGAVAASGNVASERPGIVHQTLLTLTDVLVTMLDSSQGGGTKIYDFPEGRILVLGAIATMSMKTTSTLASTLNASVTGNWGVGTTVQANGTLATTEQDLIPSTAFTSSATINVANTATSAALAAAAQFDGHTTAKDAYLNLAVAGATDIDGNATVTCTGTVLLTWLNLGDY